MGGPNWIAIHTPGGKLHFWRYPGTAPVRTLPFSNGSAKTQAILHGMKPLHRSMLFWLGLPGLVFLVWLWVDSFPRVSYVGYETSARRFVLGNDMGVLYYTQSDLSAFLRGGPGRFAAEFSQPRSSTGHFPVTTVDYLLSRDLFAKPVDIKRSTKPVSNLHTLEIQVAHWLAWLIYLLAWGAALYFRRRWRKPAEPPAEGHGMSAGVS